MKENVVLTLARSDAGQILDALNIRLESWQCTERYLLTGCVEDDYMINECSGPEEAGNMISSYEKIINSIAGQLDSSRTPH